MRAPSRPRCLGILGHPNTYTPPMAGTDVLGAIDGGDALTDSDAAEVVDLLGPVLDGAPDHEPLAEAFLGMAQSTSDDDVRLWVDWWLWVTSRTITGDVFVPRMGDYPVLASLRDLEGRHPPLAIWRARAALGPALSRADSALALDSHGNVNLPAEREVWSSAVLPSLSHIVEGLERGEIERTPTWGPGVVERSMEREGIEENSARWNRFLEVCESAFCAVADAITTSNVAGASQRRPPLPALAELSPSPPVSPSPYGASKKPRGSRASIPTPDAPSSPSSGTSGAWTPFAWVPPRPRCRIGSLSAAWTSHGTPSSTWWLAAPRGAGPWAHSALQRPTRWQRPTSDHRLRPPAASSSTPPRSSARVRRVDRPSRPPVRHPRTPRVVGG